LLNDGLNTDKIGEVEDLEDDENVEDLSENEFI